MSSNRRPVSKENRRGMVLIILVVCVLIIALAVRCRSLADKNAAYAEQIESLEGKISEEKGRTESIEKLKDYAGTRAYTEKIAREKLGLVYPDEVIFVPSE